MTDPLDGLPPAQTVAVRARGSVRAAPAIGGGLVASDVETVVVAAWETHRRDLFAFATALSRDADVADDLVAEAYLRLVRELRSGRGPDDVRGWLYRVVANLCLSRGRRLRTAQRFLGRLVDRRTEESPETRLTRMEVDPRLHDALLSLRPDARVALVMAARGIPGRDIAAALNRTETSTRTLLHRARLELRERLAQGVES